MRKACAGSEHQAVCLSVLIVDDNASFRAVARAILEAGGYRITAEAESGAAALAHAARVRPDVVLLDIRLPDVNGFTVCQDLEAIVPVAVIVLCSVYDIDQYGEAIARSRAAGFITKSRLSVEALSRILATTSDEPGSGCDPARSP